MLEEEEGEEEDYEKALYASGVWFIGGFFMLADPFSTFETNWAFAIMFWFSAFLNLLRFKYAQYWDKFWLEEGMENMILVGFALPGVILGLYYYPNPWFMVITEIASLSVWFVLWRFCFEELVHGFWH